MRFNKMTILGGVALVLAGLAYLYLLPGSPDSVPVSVTEKPSTSGILSSNPFAKLVGDAPEVRVEDPKPGKPIVDLSYNTSSFKGALLPQRLAAMSARRNGRAFDPQAVADALKSDVAWESDPSIGNDLPISNAERKDGREFIRINPLKIEALMKGDEISLPITQMKKDGPVRMVVDEVVQGADDNITWHGHLTDFGTENQVSFTRGDSLIVGGVSKPDKNYVVQINGDVGWIVDGFTIFTGKHDAIVPPGQEGGASTANGHLHSH